MTTFTIFANNIKCDGCVNSIRTGLMKIKGVNGVDVSKEESKVSVSGVAIAREEIVSELESLGYPEKGNNNLLRKAQSFITCMISNSNEK